MSYIVRDERPRRSPALLISLGVVALVVVTFAAFLLGRHAGSDTATGPALSWSRVGEVPVPSSTSHGPRRTADGLASGFSHDALGAALAAVHISYRVLPSVPRLVAAQTVRRQCFGDLDGYLDRLERFAPAATTPLPSTPDVAFYYRVVAGDPTGPSVRIAVAGTLDGGATGYVDTVRTLRWVDEDWRMELPPPRPTLVGSVDGYAVLGRSDG